LLHQCIDLYFKKYYKDEFEAEQQVPTMEGKKPAPRRVWWIPILIGIFERAIITTLIAYSVSGSGSFMGTWTAIKIAGGWQQWSSGTRYARSILFAGLLGSAMSMLIALIGGILCLKTHSVIQISD